MPVAMRYRAFLERASLFEHLAQNCSPALRGRTQGHLFANAKYLRSIFFLSRAKSFHQPVRNPCVDGFPCLVSPQENFIAIKPLGNVEQRNIRNRQTSVDR